MSKRHLPNSNILDRDSGIKALNRAFSRESPETILEYVKDECLEEAAMTSALQVSGVVIMHMMKRIGMDIPVYFINTGFHFPETLEYRDRLKKELYIDLRTIRPQSNRKQTDSRRGPQLYESDPDVCCQMNKVQPLNDLKKAAGKRIWISGLRRDQGGARAHYNHVMVDGRGFIRIHPLLRWKWEKVWDYIIENRLPYHPLYDQGYTSIGCFPLSCTSKNEIEKGERRGRWAKHKKNECGLHLDLR